jgi:hypothetical protein
MELPTQQGMSEMGSKPVLTAPLRHVRLAALSSLDLGIKTRRRYANNRHPPVGKSNPMTAASVLPSTASAGSSTSQTCKCAPSRTIARPMPLAPLSPEL